ncbi:MAG: hypothetical protein JNL19_08800 [Burkholderiales bacterium]|nr:hypothetical protein [Burkholderiales bacterium]
MFRNATLSPTVGSWSDAEREALGGGERDLQDALRLLPYSPAEAHAGELKTVAIASPMSATLGLTDLTPLDASRLALDDSDARALCTACDAHLANEGVRLTFVDSQHWLVSINEIVSALTERPDWITGEPLRPNLPRGADARRVERWMNELQMLLYTHPVNVAREDRGLPPINVVWLWAFSTVSGGDTVRGAPSTSSGVNAELTARSVHGELIERRSDMASITTFAQAFRNGDLPAWQLAWSAHSSSLLQANQIILGDAHPRLKLTPHVPGWLQTVRARFARPPTLAAVLGDLHARARELSS